MTKARATREALGWAEMADRLTIQAERYDHDGKPELAAVARENARTARSQAESYRKEAQ